MMLIAGARVPARAVTIDRAVSMPFTLFQLYQLTGNRLGKNHRAVNPAHDAGSSGGL
jgi:hypothetical protein